MAASVGMCMAASPAMAQAPNKVNIACGDVAALITAVEEANTNAAGGTINLAKDCAYRFVDDYGSDSGNALPAITGNVAIVGHNSTLIRSVSGGSPLFRLLSVEENGTLTLKGLTVTGGRTDENGAGIANAGTLRLEDSKVAGNQTGGNGGGISNEGGDVTLVDTEILTNVATSPTDDPGDGGGLSNSATGTLTLRKSTVAGNTADENGGGIQNEGTLTVEHGLITNNEARDGNGGAINNLGTANIKHSKLIENWAGLNGGAVNNVAGGTLEIQQSALANNKAGNDGGAVNNAGTATLKKAKVESNSAGHDGGGINNAEEEGGDATQLTLEHTTVAENRAANVGGGINNQAGAVVTLKESKIIKNLPANCAGTVPDCS
ncbi:hypothetical protein [Streptomyces sp. NBC_01233]|uniref:hypothetical protein n=1 Tax=Streptomyces sp. NBC_01233 TaxID=2903787 RepID=UPI002E16408C|nr:hypothetical protein OG332_26205 [Streptomyces sp. NBC_01233]